MNEFLRSGRFLWIGMMVLAVARAEIKEAPSGSFADQGAATRFAMVLERIDDSAAPGLIGYDTWKTLVEDHRARVETAPTHREFARRLNALFRATGQSHLEYETDEDWGYWHLCGAFRLLDDAKVEHIGIFPQRIEDRWFVRGILEGTPEEHLDIRVGDELVAVDGNPYSPVKAFEGLAGRDVELTLRRSEDGPTHAVTVVPREESLNDVVENAMSESVAFVAYEDHFFAYAHIWMLLGQGREYERLLKMQKRVEGLVLDFRDGVGGMTYPAMQFLMGRNDVDRAEREARSWVKPVVILTADGTRSAKELVVDAVKNAKRGALVGAATPGHVTAVGGMPRLGADAVLILPGFRFPLEGKPTRPDYPIERDIRYCAGKDFQLKKALDVLVSQLEFAPQPATAPR